MTYPQYEGLRDQLTHVQANLDDLRRRVATMERLYTLEIVAALTYLTRTLEEVHARLQAAPPLSPPGAGAGEGGE